MAYMHWLKLIRQIFLANSFYLHGSPKFSPSNISHARYITTLCYICNMQAHTYEYVYISWPWHNYICYLLRLSLIKHSIWFSTLQLQYCKEQLLLMVSALQHKSPLLFAKSGLLALRGNIWVYLVRLELVSIKKMQETKLFLHSHWASYVAM